MDQQYRSLDEFWPFYVSQHLHPVNRAFHFAGTSVGLVLLAAALVLNNAYCVPAGLVLSYGLAWIGHFGFERNKPATFEYPFYSFVSDFRMYGLMWRGRMQEEILRLIGRRKRAA